MGFYSSRPVVFDLKEAQTVLAQNPSMGLLYCIKDTAAGIEVRAVNCYIQAVEFYAEPGSEG